MDGLQTARLPLDSMITQHSLSSALSSISLSLAFCLYLFLPSLEKEPPYSVCLQNSEKPPCCWFVKACIIFALLYMGLVNVSFCSAPRKCFNLNYISPIFPFLLLPVSPFLQLLFISFSLADGQLARKTVGQQVKNPFTLALSLTPLFCLSI